MNKHMNKYEQTWTNMNKYEQLHIYDKVCVYNEVYEGNIPVSMIHLYTRGSGLILGERPIEFIQSYANKYLQKGLGLIPTWRPMIYFWEDLKKTSIFYLLFKVKKQADRGMYKKVYIQKGVQ